MAKATVSEMTHDLLRSVGIDPTLTHQFGTEGDDTTKRTPEACSALRIEERTQRRFRNFSQVLVAVLALVALLLLVWAAIQLAAGASIDALLTGIGGLVTGTGATFLEGQRRDARKAHQAAFDAYVQSGC